MASSGKKKTTMAKLAREHKLRERRLAKQAKKEARRNAPVEDVGMPGLETGLEGNPGSAAGASPAETTETRPELREPVVRNPHGNSSSPAGS